MKLKTLLYVMSVSTILTMSPLLASAQSESSGGSNGGGGGDMESEFKGLATNIGDWIKSGRAAALKLPRGLTAEKYKAEMLKDIGSYSIEMVTRELKYGGATKTCVSRRTPTDKVKTLRVRNQIVCNQNLFRDTYNYNIDGAYRLVHHEFAGLGGLEQNRGQESDYVISDQISQFLEVVTTRRLPVSVSKPYTPKGLRTVMCGKTQLVQTHDDQGPETENSTGFGDADVEPRDFVAAQFADKKSLLYKTLLAKQMVWEPESDSGIGEDTYSVGDTVHVGHSGRVENYTTEFMIPIVGSGKRWESVVAYVRVTFTFDWLHDPSAVPPFTNSAQEIQTFTITGVFSPDSPKDGVDFNTESIERANMTSAACRNVTIPKTKPASSY